MSCFFLAAAIFVCLYAPGGVYAVEVDPQRVDEIAAMLSENVFAFGPNITDRSAWSELGKRPAFHGSIARAEELLSEPIAPLSDDLFLEFSRTGNRDHYERVCYSRAARLMPLVIAECVENRGRFIPAIDQLVAALDQQKTWMLPAHDTSLKNFHGEAQDIDLASSGLACDLASAEFLLGNTLSPSTRGVIDRNLRRRVLDPFREMVTGKRQPNWWINTKNNWNAVCLANVLGTALANLPDRHDRAIFAAAAEKYSLNYLEGFSQDGYCVEGLGYWNYGFGNYLRLCELLYQATGGKVDCFDRAKVRAIADFPRKFRIMGDIYPAYADVPFDSRPNPVIADFAARRFQLPDEFSVPPVETVPRLRGVLREIMMMACPNSATGIPAIAPQAQSLRDWFENAQVLTCRPGSSSDAKLAVSIKGGRNGVSHGHCDLGSFVLVAGNTPLLVDPGAEVYTARTFSSDRLKSNVINSFGHNVPFVADQLQVNAPTALVTILQRRFSDSTDALAMDLTHAYAVGQLTSLVRTFTYDRRNGGSLTIEDECHFSAPARFGIQFITFGKWKQVSATQLLVWQGHEAIQIDLSTGPELSIQSTVIDEDLPGKVKPTHISVDLKSPTESVKLKSVIRATAALE